MADKYNDINSYDDNPYENYSDESYSTDINHIQSEYDTSYTDEYADNYDEYSGYLVDGSDFTNVNKSGRTTDIMINVKKTAEKFAYEMEIYQVMGLIGALLLIIGAFCPMLTINYFDSRNRINYLDGDGIIVILLAFTIVAMIIVNKHKFIIIPAIAALAINLSVEIGLLTISDYVEFDAGFYLVWIGGFVVIISAFLINSGYARDSAFRKNKPLYFRDILWISIAIAGAFIIANIATNDGIIANYAEEINQLEEPNSNTNSVIVKNEDAKENIEAAEELDDNKSALEKKIYFEKPDSWGDKVYAYIYLQKGQSCEELSKWPGKAMKEATEGVFMFEYDDYWEKGMVLFSDGKSQIPQSGQNGIKLENVKKVLGIEMNNGNFTYEIR